MVAGDDRKKTSPGGRRRAVKPPTIKGSAKDVTRATSPSAASQAEPREPAKATTTTAAPASSSSSAAEGAPRAAQKSQGGGRAISDVSGDSRFPGSSADETRGVIAAGDKRFESPTSDTAAPAVGKSAVAGAAGAAVPTSAAASSAAKGASASSSATSGSAGSTTGGAATVGAGGSGTTPPRGPSGRDGGGGSSGDAPLPQARRGSLLAAGFLGALLVVLLYLAAAYTGLMPPLPVDDSRNLQAAVEQNSERLTVIENNVQRMRREGSPQALENRVIDLEQQVASLAEGGQVAAGGDAAGGETGSDLPQRVEALEQQIAQTAETAGGTEGVAALEERIAALEQAREEVGATAAEGATAQEDVAAVQETVSSLQSRIEELQQQVQANAQAAGTTPEETQQEIASLRQTLDQLSGSVNELQQAVETARGELQGRMETLQGELARTDASARTILALSSLRSSVQAGQPYATELGMLKALAPQPIDTAVLDAHAEQGLASTPELRRDFDRVTTAMMIAGDDRTEGYVGEMLGGLRSLVRVRPAGDVEGEGRAATISRIDQALERGDVTAAYEAWQSLEEPARQAAPEFGQKLEARAQAEQEMASVTNAISGDGGAGGQPADRRPAADQPAAEQPAATTN